MLAFEEHTAELIRGAIATSVTRCSNSRPCQLTAGAKLRGSDIQVPTSSWRARLPAYCAHGGTW